MPTTHRTIALLGLTAALGATVGAPATQARKATKPAGPVLKIESKACNVGTADDARTIVLTASAVLRDTGDEVQMRFSVQQRATKKSAWRTVFAKVGDLGSWATSEPGADGLRYTKTINGLAQGMQYRVVVDARAVTESGKVVTKTSRRTITCIQPQISALLELQKVAQPSVVAGPTLRVTVRNAGKETSAAPVITVRDTTTRAVLGEVTGEPLEGKVAATLPVTLSACDGTVSVTVQPKGAALTEVTPDQTTTFTCRTGGAPEGTKARRARR